MRQITERFLAAAKLCVGPETAKERLTNAWINHLEGINTNDIPAQLRPEFRRLKDVMNTAHPLPNETAASASIRKLSVKQASVETNRILQLSFELLHISYQSDAIQKSEQAEQTEGLFFSSALTPDRLN